MGSGPGYILIVRSDIPYLCSACGVEGRLINCRILRCRCKPRPKDNWRLTPKSIYPFSRNGPVRNP